MVPTHSAVYTQHVGGPRLYTAITDNIALIITYVNSEGGVHTCMGAIRLKTISQISQQQCFDKTQKDSILTPESGS